MSYLAKIRADAKSIVTGITNGINIPAVFKLGVSREIETRGLYIRRTDILEYADGAKDHSPYASISVDYDIFEFTEKYISLKDWTVEVDGFIYDVIQSNHNTTTGIIQCDLKDVPE